LCASFLFELPLCSAEFIRCLDLLVHRDVEYDRGRSKKVKNKAVKEQFSNVESNGVADGAVKPNNPFQALGFAKKMGNGVKKGNGNSIGFKAGYGYGLKTGKDAG
jgi:hypothetical protein